MKKSKLFFISMILIMMSECLTATVGDSHQWWASYYHNWFHGRKTSNGEVYNKHDFTAAHAFLPFGTKLKITNPSNGKSVIVKVNDRCATILKGARFDMSLAAAKYLGSIQAGVIKAVVEEVDQSLCSGPIINFLEPQTQICSNEKSNQKSSETKNQHQEYTSSEVNTGTVEVANKEEKSAVVKNYPIPTLEQEKNSDLSLLPFSIQVGAFDEMMYVNNTLKNLKNKGHKKTRVYTDNIARQGKYKVLVGHYSTYNKAKEYVKALQSQKFATLIVKL